MGRSLSEELNKNQFGAGNVKTCLELNNARGSFTSEEKLGRASDEWPILWTQIIFKHATNSDTSTDH